MHRHLIDSARTILVLIDEHGQVTFASDYASRFFGVSQADVTGKSLVGTMVPETDAAAHDVRTTVERALSQPDRHFRNEWEFICNDGRRVWVRWATKAVVNDEGQLIGLAWSGTDVTQLRLAEAELRRAQRMQTIGTLAGGVAHDFNNLLASIVVNAELTLEDVSLGKSPSKRMLEAILTASKRSIALIRQIQAFSQVTDEKPATINLGPIVKETLKLLRRTLPVAVEMRHSIASESDAAVVEPTRIHQLVIDLCTQTRQAMGEAGGVLEVTLEAVEVEPESAAEIGDLDPGPYLMLQVGDGGRGNEGLTLQRGYEPFHTPPEVGGETVMDVAAARDTVERHDGRLACWSTEAGGRVFTVLLPRAHESPLSPPAARTSAVPGVNEQILLVDDEEDLLAVAKRALESHGYSVTACHAPEQALETFAADPQAFDVVVTDLAMPKMTGIELGIGLRRERDDIALILCTGRSEQGTEDQAREAGFCTVLMKPFGRHVLLAAVRRALDGDC